MIQIVLPYPISANRYWATRVVAPKGKRPMALTYVTPEAMAYKKRVGLILRAAGVRSPIAGRVSVDIKLYPKRPQDWAKRAKADPLFWADSVMRLDLDNARKVVNDAMKDIAFGDDKCIWRDSGEVMEPDGREACLVVTIAPIVADSPQKGLI